MKHRPNFHKSLPAVLSTPCVPDLLVRLLMRNQPALSMAMSVIAGFYVVLDSIGQISAIGIGPLGAKIARFLIPDSPDINCHELIFDSEVEQTGELAEIFSVVRQSNLLFILAGFDDYYCEATAQALGQAAMEAGILTIAVAPCLRKRDPQQPVAPARWYDTIISVSDMSLPSQYLAPGDAATGYAMSHLVTVIANLFHTHGFGIDSQSIKMVLRSGEFGRLGVGVAFGPARGEVAVMSALECLSGQGVNISGVIGALICVEVSSDFTMKDLEDVSMTIDARFATDVDVRFGMLRNDRLGCNLQVTIMAVSPALNFENMERIDVRLLY